VRVGMVGVYRGHGKGVVVGQLLDGERVESILQHFRDARVAQRILLHL